MTLKTAARLVVLIGGSIVCVSSAAAQTPPAAGAAPAPPALLQITREEVRPGKGAAHAANEAAWASAFIQAQSPIHWLGMTTVSGPSEAWFLSAYDSFAAFEKADTSVEANPSLQAEQDRLSAIDGEMLARTSNLIARFRPSLSYQAAVVMPNMRYMTIDLVRVKAGHVAAFSDAWRDMIEAHQKAKIDEHWAVYEVESGMLDTTFLFMYPRASLAGIDASGPMHGAAFRESVGDSGRRQMDDAYRNGVEMSQTIHFRLRPGMSTLPKEWATTDAYWAPQPPPGVKAPAKKKKS